MRNRLDPEESYDLWATLDSTYYSVLRARDQELREDGIMFTQCAVLARIKLAGDKANPSEIARRMSREPHSISQIISRMEKSGLVHRVPDSRHNNKRIMIQITERGEQIYQTARQRESFNRIMSRLSPAKRRRLLQLLREVRQNALLELGITDPDL
jgi:MarR family transcriptional regulator, transcriptional regulator for hemolysin